jgi:hypothetical protein
VYKALEGAHSSMGIDVPPADRTGMLEHSAGVARLSRSGVDVVSTALGEALLCPGTLKC